MLRSSEASRSLELAELWGFFTPKTPFRMTILAIRSITDFIFECSLARFLSQPGDSIPRCGGKLRIAVSLVRARNRAYNCAYNPLNLRR